MYGMAQHYIDCSQVGTVAAAVKENVDLREGEREIRKARTWYAIFLCDLVSWRR